MSTGQTTIFTLVHLVFLAAIAYGLWLRYQFKQWDKEQIAKKCRSMQLQEAYYKRKKQQG